MNNFEDITNANKTNQLASLLKGSLPRAFKEGRIKLQIPDLKTNKIEEATAGSGVQVEGSSIDEAGFIGPVIEPGTVGSGLTAVTTGIGNLFLTTLSFTDYSFDVAAAANEAFGKLIYTLPANDTIVILSSVMSVQLTGGGVVDADTPDVGIGTADATGAFALLSAAPAGSENIITGTTASAVDGSDVLNAGSGALLSTAVPKTIYFNVADGWAGADTVSVTGIITLFWTVNVE